MSLSLAGVKKKISRRFGLDDISFEVGAGEFVVLLGPSGCGKSSTLRLVAGLDRIDQGTISIGGAVVAGSDIHVAPSKRHLGMVFQNLALWPHMRARKQLDFVLGGSGLSRGERKERIAKYLDLVGLADRKRSYPHQLSGGELQRLALARALVVQPSLILLDEPLSAADRGLRQRLLAEIRKIQRDVELPMVYVTHDQEEALAVADRIVVMRDGRIEQIGTAREIYESPASRFVAEFVGTNNVLLAMSDASGAVQTSLGPVRCGGSSNGRSPAWVALRPEDLAIGCGDGDGVECVVESASYQGGRWLLTVVRESERFFVFDVAQPTVGARVQIQVKGEGRLLQDPPSDSES